MPKFPRFSLRSLFILLTLACVSCFWIARALSPVPYSGPTKEWADWTSSGESFETQFTYKLTDDAVARSPAWHPANANPPLSAKRALQIADTFRKKKLRNKGDWKWTLDSIALYPLRQSGNKWCWVVNFMARPESGGTSGAPSVPVFILMNGELVIPHESQYDGLKEWGIFAPDDESTPTRDAKKW